jgi:hypothetical protein
MGKHGIGGWRRIRRHQGFARESQVAGKRSQSSGRGSFPAID